MTFGKVEGFFEVECRKCGLQLVIYLNSSLNIRLTFFTTKILIAHK
jgi:ribosomal protein S27E